MFTVADIRSKITEIAAENPDFIYHSPVVGGSDRGACFYTRDNKPSCIVGHALVTLGVPIEWFTESITNAAPFDRRFMVRLINAGYLADEYSDEDITWVRHVQARQDEGNTWSDAVNSANYLYSGA